MMERPKEQKPKGADGPTQRELALMALQPALSQQSSLASQLSCDDGKW